jgi:hypothetical protein
VEIKNNGVMFSVENVFSFHPLQAISENVSNVTFVISYCPNTVHSLKKLLQTSTVQF